MLVNVFQTVRSRNPEDSVLHLIGTHTRAPKHPAFRKIRRKSNMAQVGIGSVCGQTYVYKQWNAVEMQSPPLWNSINSSMASLQPMLSPNSILLPPSCHFAFIPSSKNSAGISKALLFQYSFYFFKNCVSEIAWVRDWRAKSSYNTCEIHAGLTKTNSPYTVFNNGLSIAWRM
jgi:hypothetical protein